MNTEIKDPVWKTLKREVSQQAIEEPMLASYLHATVLNHCSLEDALSFHLAAKLVSPYLSGMTIREVIDQAFSEDPNIGIAIRSDLEANRDRDPAAQGISDPFLHYKGFHALESYRVAKWLWYKGRTALAHFLQNRISEIFGVDIH